MPVCMLICASAPSAVRYALIIAFLQTHLILAACDLNTFVVGFECWKALHSNELSVRLERWEVLLTSSRLVYFLQTCHSPPVHQMPSDLPYSPDLIPKSSPPASHYPLNPFWINLPIWTETELIESISGASRQGMEKEVIPTVRPPC
ncbi:hypothetical protein PAMP_004198 [Pampus punctatissimus]